MFFESYGDAVTSDAAFPSFRGQRLRRKGVEIYDARGENEIQQRGKERERRKERCETEERESKDCRAFCEKCWASTSRPRPPLLLLLFFLQKHTKKNNEIEIDENMGSGAERRLQSRRKQEKNKPLARSSFDHLPPHLSPSSLSPFRIIPSARAQKKATAGRRENVVVIVLSLSLRSKKNPASLPSTFEKSTFERRSPLRRAYQR